MKASFVYILVSSSFSVWNFQSVNEDRIFFSFFFFFFSEFSVSFFENQLKGGEGKEPKRGTKEMYISALI